MFSSLLPLFFSVVSTTFDPYQEHDEPMGYEFDDEGNLKDNIINHLDVDDTSNIAAESSSSAHSLDPQFDYSVFKNLTVLVGDTAYLKCRVKNIGNKTVSWVRHRDIHLLTVGVNSYTSDNRFQTIHNIEAEEWILKVKIDIFSSSQKGLNVSQKTNFIEEFSEHFPNTQPLSVN